MKSDFGSSFDFATLGFMCSVSCSGRCDLRELFRRNGESLSLTFRCTRLQESEPQGNAFRKVSCKSSCSCESLFTKIPNCTSLYEILIWSSGIPLRTGTAFFTRSNNSVKWVIGFCAKKPGVPVFQSIVTVPATDDDHEAPS